MSLNQPFREDYSTSLPFLAEIARWMNLVGHVLNNFHYSTGGEPKVTVTKDGVQFVFSNGGDGTSDDSGSYGFKITATIHEKPAPRGEGENDEEDEEEEQTFDVKILGGPAQVLGGEEHLFKDEEFEDVKDGTVFYVRYVITDEDGEAVCKWDKGFQMYEPPEDGEYEDDEDNPFVQHGKGRTLTFVIGVVSADYEDNVRQDRVGSIMAVATINASGAFVNPDAEEL